MVQSANLLYQQFAIVPKFVHQAASGVHFEVSPNEWQAQQDNKIIGTYILEKYHVILENVSQSGQFGVFM